MTNGNKLEDFYKIKITIIHIVYTIMCIFIFNNKLLDFFTRYIFRLDFFPIDPV